MPIGPYEDFDECVRAQRRKGKSLNSARNICGEIEKRSKEESKKDWRVLNFLIPIQNSFASSDGFIIKGVAINETTTRNNVKYLAEELHLSASSLIGKPILKDHDNSVDSIVGAVTQAIFNNNKKAIEFEAVIEDQAIENKIKKGFIKNVSVGAMVKELVQQENENDKVMVAKGIDFVELSLVAVPADPNANFTQAIFESFQIKNHKENSFEELEEETMIEDKKISEKEHNMKCPECGKMFENKKEMDKHMEDSHNEEKNKEEEKMEAIEQLRSELNMLREGIKNKEIAENKAKEEMKIKELEEKAKLADSLARELQELRSRKNEEKKDNTIGEVGVPQTEEKTEASSRVLIGRDKEGLCKGTVITRERYPSHLKRLNKWY